MIAEPCAESANRGRGAWGEGGRRSCPRRYVRLESIATSSEERRPLQSYRPDKHWRVQFTPGGRMNDGEIGERGEEGEVVLLNEEEVGATVPGGKVMG